jgi:chromosomal replication initiator protein
VSPLDPRSERLPVPANDLDHAWPTIRAELRRAVPESVWHVWLEPLQLQRCDGAALVVEAPAKSHEWVTERYGRLLQACSASVLGPDAVVEIVEDEPERAPDRRGPATPSRGGSRAPRATTKARGSAAPADAPADLPAAGLNPRFTFEQFVIGDSNRLAHAAALAVAEMPGLAYNPLYICGPPGLGKTHLLHSIGNYVRAYGDGMTVRYTTAEAFTNHFLAAIHGTGIDRFKAAYRGVDVLLVDDVQFLQSKVRTEEEFFHTFNTLHAGGAQIVLTSDRLPRDLGALEDRLRERFEAGLVCDVQPPDQATRLTVLRKRAVQDGLDDVAPTALERIAERVVTNVRALEGALIRVVAFGSLTGRPVTAELADEVLSGLYPELRPRTRTVQEIQEQTCEAFGVSLQDLVSASRAAELTWPRQVAMYLARELTDQSLPAIGSAFGGRKHTTVMHACKRTAQRIAADADAFADVQRLTRQLGVER